MSVKDLSDFTFGVRAPIMNPILYVREYSTKEFPITDVLFLAYTTDDEREHELCRGYELKNRTEHAIPSDNSLFIRMSKNESNGTLQIDEVDVPDDDQTARENLPPDEDGIVTRVMHYDELKEQLAKNNDNPIILKDLLWEYYAMIEKPSDFYAANLED